MTKTRSTLRPDLFRACIRVAPAIVVAFLSLPVISGLAGVVMPAFGWMPALGGTQLSIEPWRELLATRGLGQMLGVSLSTALVSATVSLLIVLLFLGAFLQTRLFATVRRLLSPLLAVPHAAAAIGLVVLLSPSGLMPRLISPGLSGWEYTPDYLFPSDPYGLALMTGLIIKEVPFLLLMSLAALPQCQADERVRVARALGYAPVTAFFKSVVPALYRLLRFPLFAVIAFASSTVDVALILGPSTPPTLAVAVLRWLNDPDLTMRFMASAAAVLQLGLTLTALMLWWLGERTVARLCRHWLQDGRRRWHDRTLAVLAFGAMLLCIVIVLTSLVGLVLWSFAGYWPFPAAFPEPFTLRNWMNAQAGLSAPFINAIVIGLGATALSAVLCVGALESEVLLRRPMRPWAQLILYLPLLVPSVAFLFGLVLLQTQLRIQPGLSILVFGHAVFVLPYVFLSLAESYRRLDPRWEHLARSLGASPVRVLFRVRLPMLALPLFTAAAVGFSVSIGQYLPTLLLGAGRVSTITTEAVGSASGGNRRVMAVYALLQLLLPALGFMLAIALPRLLFRRRSALLTAS